MQYDEPLPLRKCGYCDVPVDPPDAKELLSLEVVHQTLLDARSLGFDTFWFLGGEPSLREDAEAIFDPLSEDPDLRLTVVTNGKRRNDGMVQALFNTAASRACIQISLDTFAPDNLKRADPAESLSLIADLKAAADSWTSPGRHREVEVHCVISRENRETFDDFARFFAAKGVPVSLAMVCPWHEVQSPAHHSEFTRDELEDIAVRIEKLSTGLSIDAFNAIVASFLRGILRGNTVRRQATRRCGAGLTHLIINGNGDVHRCMTDSFAPETQMGNICESRLHRILRHADDASTCALRTECFDGFAWDSLALS